MKVSVGIPVYDGKLPLHLVHCLLTETHLAAVTGDLLSVRFLQSCSNLAMGRNQLVKEFLASDEDRLVFVDADVTFKPGSVLKIAHSPLDFVGGAYRLKQEIEDYPVGYLGDEGVIKNGILEVASIPTGFLSLSRKVFETFKAKYPGRDYKIHGHPGYAYFQIPFKDGCLYTEDAFFCREWQECGGKIHLDTDLELTHWDFNRPYPGHFGNWLKNGAGIFNVNERKESHGKETPRAQGARDLGAPGRSAAKRAGSGGSKGSRKDVRPLAAPSVSPDALPGRKSRPKRRAERVAR